LAPDEFPTVRGSRQSLSGYKLSRAVCVKTIRRAAPRATRTPSSGRVVTGYVRIGRGARRRGFVQTGVAGAPLQYEKRKKSKFFLVPIRVISWGASACEGRLREHDRRAHAAAYHMLYGAREKYA